MGLTAKLFPRGSRLSRILTLSLPIIGAQVSQNIVNLIDTAMVGRVGVNALAAVGMGGFMAFVFQSIFMGLGTGVQAQVSRRKGEGEYSKLAFPLNAGLFIIFTVGLIFSGIVYSLVPSIFPLLNNDPNVLEGGIPYLEMRSLGLIFVSTNFCFRAFWNGVDRPSFYLGTLVITNLTNVVLNYTLIFGKFGFPEMGIEGAGLATTISYVVGTLTYFFLGFSQARSMGFLKSLPSKLRIKYLLKISLPNSMQQLFFSLGFTTMFWIIGEIGTPELGASNVLINLILVAILPGLGFGLANTTLVGQAIGKGDNEDAKLWGWQVSVVCIIFVFIITIPFWAIPTFVIKIFTDESIVIELAKLPLIISGIFICIDSAGLTLMNALLGAGDSKRTMQISIFTQWILFLPIAFFIGPHLGYGLIEVWCWYALYRIIQSALFAWSWHQERWKGIAV